MFQAFPWQTAVLFDDSQGRFPSTLSCVDRGLLNGQIGDTLFGYVHTGPVQITSQSGSYALTAGMYFSIPGECQIEGAGRAIVIARHNFTGFFQLGGPTEHLGRLRYINGCSDSLLISPTVSGDACLNLLHIPSGTQQTRHTHPSLRAGLIVRGIDAVGSRDDLCYSGTDGT